MLLKPGGSMKSIENMMIGLFFSISFCILHCDGHGRLIEPPSRASAWRYGFQTPPDYNDHELYCGGFTRQWKRNSGKCGECGDPWDLPEPRPHESGGQWGQGTIVRSYFPGSDMTIRVELTASHMGYFEFRLCPKQRAKQLCLDRNVLPIMGGFPSQSSPADLHTRFYPRNGSRIYEIKARLPDLTCDHCVLQWRYVAGNNWGICNDGNGAVGCGPQEEFRSCSDITLTLDSPIRLSRPLFPSPTQSGKIAPTSEHTTDKNRKELLTYLFLFSVVLAIFLCVLGILYRSEQIKKFLCKKPIFQERKQFLFGNLMEKIFSNKCKCDIRKIGIDLSNDKVNNPPIRPPRTKKLGSVIQIQFDESTSA